MKIIMNDQNKEVSQSTSVFNLRDTYFPTADICIYNGFPIKEDMDLKENDSVYFITRGIMPSEEVLEHAMVSRHTPGVHEKVKKSCVGVAGLGGLGSNIAIQLARIGVGKLILVDFDVVEPSNLNRQQYYIKHIGMKKTEAIKEQLKEINPYITIETMDLFLDEKNIVETFKEADIIVEAFDSPKSKADIVNTVLSRTDKYIVAASGLAGYFSNNTITTKRITDKFYLIGDDESEAKPGCGLMAPRAALAASHQANTVLRLIMGEFEV